jgi:hypothetical protein
MSATHSLEYWILRIHGVLVWTWCCQAQFDKRHNISHSEVTTERSKPFFGFHFPGCLKSFWVNAILHRVERLRTPPPPMRTHSNLGAFTTRSSKTPGCMFGRLSEQVTARTCFCLWTSLCGLAVRVPGYRPRGPGSIPGAAWFSEK